MEGQSSEAGGGGVKRKFSEVSTTSGEDRAVLIEEEPEDLKRSLTEIGEDQAVVPKASVGTALVSESSAPCVLSAFSSDAKLHNPFAQVRPVSWVANIKEPESLETSLTEIIADRELLISIFEKVKSNKDKRSFSYASKDCFKARCFNLKNLTSNLPSLLNLVLPASPNLNTFRSSALIQNSHLELLGRSCLKLQQLILKRRRGSVIPIDLEFDDDGLREMASCIELVTVELTRRVKIGDGGVISVVESAQKLQSLVLEGCINVSDESLAAIRNLTKLKHLNVRGCTRITNDGLRYLANGATKDSLGSLYLSGTNITGVGLEALVNIRGIRALDLCGLVNVDDNLLYDISIHCLAINYLYLNGCVDVKGEALAHFKDLEYLEMVNCPELTWEHVETAAGEIEGLMEIVLDRRLRDPPTATPITEDIQFGDNDFDTRVKWV